MNNKLRIIISVLMCSLILAITVNTKYAINPVMGETTAATAGQSYSQHGQLVSYIPYTNLEQECQGRIDTAGRYYIRQNSLNRGLRLTGSIDSVNCLPEHIRYTQIFERWSGDSIPWNLKKIVTYIHNKDGPKESSLI